MIILKRNITLVIGDRDTVQAVICRLLAAKARGLFHVNLYMICGEEFHRDGFPPNTLAPLPIHFRTNRSISLIYYPELVQRAIYDLSIKEPDLK
jgi:hypothetical protein